MTHIKTAARLEGIAEYYFASKLKEIAGMNANGVPVINLGIGSPDLAPHPAVTAALHDSAQRPDTHGYQSYTGIPRLRQAWAQWYHRHFQVSVDPDREILPLMGSKEGIVHIAMTFLEPGDLALAPDPGYPAYRAATSLAGAEVRYYTLRESTQWQPDWADLEKQDLSRVKLMWVNYPHMPTGAPAAGDTFERLVHFGLKHNILIINDNPYSFILNDQTKSILSAPGAMDIALELNSLSKSHNMAGWRMGAVLGRADYLSAILRFKSNMDSGQFLPAQMAAAAALSLPETWYEDLNQVYAERRETALQLLRHTGARVTPGQQGLFLWAKAPAAWEDGYAMSDHYLRHGRVFFTPGGIFGEAGRPYIRLSLCQPVAVMREAIERCMLIQPEGTHSKP